MVIPACSSTALIWSSRILISSVISAGALPDLSKPIRPARYSVLPVRMPSLNGNCGLASGRWMARRLNCAGAWENAPLTVSNMAATSATNAKTALRFSADFALLCMVSSIDFAAIWQCHGKQGREFIPYLDRMQASRGEDQEDTMLLPARRTSLGSASPREYVKARPQFFL